MTLQLAVKRAYEHVHESDGRRVLVDRLWPRGLKKGRAQVDTWVKDAAPSTELRKWFGHNPARWGTFQERYVEELHANPQVDRLACRRTRASPVGDLGRHSGAIGCRSTAL